MTSQQELRELGLYELQERVLLGEISLNAIGEGCWDELCIYRDLLDEFHVLLNGGDRWQEHHDAIYSLHCLTYSALEASGHCAEDVQMFQRVLAENERYHRDWIRKVLHPLGERLQRQLEAALEIGDDSDRTRKLQQAVTLLEKVTESYQQFLKLKEIGEEIVGDFFEEGSIALRLQPKLESTIEELEKNLQIEREKQIAKMDKLPQLDTQREAEKLTGKTSTELLCADYGLAPGTLSKQLRKWRDEGLITESAPRRFTPDDVEKARALLVARQKKGTLKVV